jgi:hypothetical protein
MGATAELYTHVFIPAWKGPTPQGCTALREAYAVALQQDLWDTQVFEVTDGDIMWGNESYEAHRHYGVDELPNLAFVTGYLVRHHDQIRQADDTDRKQARDKNLANYIRLLGDLG